MTRRGIAVFVAILACSGVAAGQPADEAERLYTEGQQAYDSKHYDAALVAWTRSFELSKLPALVFNIAQAHRLRGACGDAVANYRKFIELDPASSERSDAESWIHDLEPCPVVAPKPKPKPVVVPPGESRGRTKQIIGLVVAGAGVAAVATGMYFGNRATTLADEVKAACATGCAFADVRSKDAEGRTAENRQYVLLGAGAVAIATGGVLFVLGSRTHAAPIAIVPRGDGASVTWTGSW